MAARLTSYASNVSVGMMNPPEVDPHASEGRNCICEPKDAARISGAIVVLGFVGSATVVGVLCSR